MSYEISTEKHPETVAQTNLTHRFSSTSLNYENFCLLLGLYACRLTFQLCVGFSLSVGLPTVCSLPLQQNLIRSC